MLYQKKCIGVFFIPNNNYNKKNPRTKCPRIMKSEPNDLIFYYLTLKPICYIL